MKSLKVMGGYLAVLVSLVAVFSLLPLGTGLEFVVDEGYETIKAFLVHNRFCLYREIWDDQPPLFTMLLAGAFKIGGPCILSARLVSLGFALILFLVFYELTRRSLGQSAALLAAFFLMCSPGIIPISVAVMQEVPTIGMALLSALLLFEWRRRRHWGLLLASGAVFGVALQIKLTAMMVLPAVLVEFALIHRFDSKSGERNWLRDAATHGVIWGTALLTVFTIIGLFWAQGSFEAGWRAHAEGQPVSGFGSPEDCAFPVKLLWTHFDVVAFAAWGLILMIKQRGWRECAFPVTLLITAAAIHSWHRPWWNYYYLHWAVPLAWLAGGAAMSVAKAGILQLSEARFSLYSGQTWKALVLCGLAAGAIARSETRIEQTIFQLRAGPRIDSDPIVAAMRAHAGKTHWAYCDTLSNMKAFHVRLLVPPEIAVVTSKRFWSGQITPERIVTVCEQYRPEQLLLSSPPGKTWELLLARDYSLVATNRGTGLYVARRILE